MKRGIERGGDKEKEKNRSKEGRRITRG